ncbi:MAG: A/G-specific adenine glycosylase [Chitinophagales bacterium]|nr:A/G-specific adenine glycosylase [Chitinophagales bacterium]MCZ2392956.1 A/G-specific adenine glycosylase [Chitinophagales bacterium]
MYPNFKKTLIQWSNDHKRLLPWQNTKNPYHIWLREVILQQTRIEQGSSYYHTFLMKYPDIQHLASSSLEDIYKSWEGLGYYSRAKNLHQTAQFIVEHYQGIFPRQYDLILQLKGIGEYTAAAIASFAFDLPYPTLDGNTYRVLARFFGVEIPIDTTEGKKYFKQLAVDCLDFQYPAQYNQALIDLGATICKPMNPLCEQCPLSSNCEAFNKEKISLLPVKSKKINIQERFFHFFIIHWNHQVYIQQRKQKDIWQFLFQFPMIEANETKVINHEDLATYFNGRFQIIEESEIFIQILTHRKIKAKFWEVRASYLQASSDWILIPFHQIKDYSYPKIIREYLSKRYNYIY